MILVCAATGTEAGACRRGIADAGAPGFAVLTTGVGPDRAADALTRWLGDARTRAADARPALIVSAGFAGALTPGIDRLAWITAASVYRLEAGLAAPLALPRGVLRVADGAMPCAVLSADRVLARDVAGLPAPAAVDMESAALAEVAGAAGLPFLVLRMVTDTPATPLAAVGRRLAAALSAEGVAERAAHVARAAGDAARAPITTAAFLRDAVRWRSLLRRGWHARAGGMLGATVRTA